MPPPVRGQAKTSANDALAELARLIGQTDPFGEYGHAASRPASPPPAEYSNWSSRPARSPYAEQGSVDPRQTLSTQRSAGDRPYSGRAAPGDQSMGQPSSDAGQNYGRQSYGGTPSTAGEDFYQSYDEARGYAPNQGEYQHDQYEQDTAQYGEEEYYEIAPPPRRRFAVMAIASVIALAVVGTAGAFGYRALFGWSASSQPPPVIMADAAPSKIVPAITGKDAQANKLITERINERGQSEKLVSREEQPIDRPATVVLSQAVPQLALGSGVVGSEPKKVRTIAIRPDQPVVADGISQAAAASARPPVAAAAPAGAQPADNSTADSEADANPPATRSRQAASGPGNRRYH